MPIDYTSAVGQVRLLINDVDEPNLVFPDDQLEAFLTLESGSVKRAAAQAIDAQATNEALAAKVLKTHAKETDGAKLADAMRKHADSLRKQADRDEDLADGGFAFEIVDLVGDEGCWPERTAPPIGWL
jgi:hypothetical protein